MDEVPIIYCDRLVKNVRTLSVCVRWGRGGGGERKGKHSSDSSPGHGECRSKPK